MLSFKKYFLGENYQQQVLFRVMRFSELNSLLSGKWTLSNPEHISAKDIRTGRGRRYYRSFFRNVNEASRDFLTEPKTVLVEFDKTALSNIRGTKFAPVDYYSNYDEEKMRRFENEDRMYNDTKILNIDPKRIINVIYFKDTAKPEKLIDKINTLNIPVKRFNMKNKSFGYSIQH